MSDEVDRRVEVGDVILLWGDATRWKAELPTTRHFSRKAVAVSDDELVRRLLSR